MTDLSRFLRQSRLSRILPSTALCFATISSFGAGALAQDAALASAQTIWFRDFEAPALPSDVSDDSAWAGGTVPLRLVDSGDARFGRVLEAQTSGYAQIQLGSFSLEAGQNYRVSLDVSSKGGQTLEIGVRQIGEPYHSHAQVVEQSYETMRRITFYVRNVQNTEPARVQVVMRGTTTLGFDNVRVEKVVGALPPLLATNPEDRLLRGSAPSSGNLLPNSGFELGRDGWMTRGEVEWVSAPTSPTKHGTNALAAANKISNVVPGAFAGRGAVLLQRGGQIYSTWLPLSLRHEYVLTARAKALSPNAELVAGFGDYVNFRDGFTGKSARFDLREGADQNGWKRVVFRWKPPIPDGQILPARPYYVEFGAQGPDGSGVLLDQIEVRASSREAGDGLTPQTSIEAPYQPLALEEFAVSTDATYGVATQGESVTAQVRCSQLASVPIALRLFDEQDRLVKTWRGRTDNGSARIKLGALPNGAWRLIAARDETDSPQLKNTGATDGKARSWQGEAMLLVVPPQPQVPVASWHFGAHLPENRDLRRAASKLGWRWNRLHDTVSFTKWPATQNSPGTWTWNDARARDLSQTQALLGSLDSLPRWLPKTSPDQPPQGQVTTTKELREATFGAWREYCRQSAARYANTIREWEITNEPNLSGMTPEHFARVMEEARIGVREGNPRATIVALGGATPPSAPWIDEALRAGAAKAGEAMSIHNYGGTTWSSAQGPQALSETVASLRAKRRASGAGQGALYDSEAGLIIRSAFSKWHQPLGDTAPTEAAQLLPKAVACVLASGLDRWFYYAAFEQSHPGEGAAFTAVDLNSSFKPAFQPMAVAISLLEGRAFVTSGAPKNPDLVDLQFQGRGSKVRIVWAKPNVTPVDVEVPARTRVLTMWGRPLVPTKGRVSASAQPLYLIAP